MTPFHATLDIKPSRSCEGPANRLEAKEGESEGEAKSKGL